MNRGDGMCARCRKAPRHVSMPSGYVGSYCRPCDNEYSKEYEARRRAQGNPIPHYRPAAPKKQAVPGRKQVPADDDPRYAETTRKWKECEGHGGHDPDPEDLTEARTPKSNQARARSRWSAGKFTSMVQMPICRRCGVPIPEEGKPVGVAGYKEEVADGIRVA